MLTNTVLAVSAFFTSTEFTFGLLMLSIGWFIRDTWDYFTNPKHDSRK